MTPTPGGMPKPNRPQPGNEPGGANGMYGRFGQTPGQQPSRGFRQRVDGMKRGFGGGRMDSRGGMRSSTGMGSIMNRADMQQPDQPQRQPDYGRFAPGPAAGAEEVRASAPMTPMPEVAPMEAQPQPVMPQPNNYTPSVQQQPVQTVTGTRQNTMASPFGNMNFGGSTPQADEMQPRDTFMTGTSSLGRPMGSLDGQDRKRQWDRYTFGA